MANPPTTISQAALWRSTLAEVANDEFSSERERLRSSFTSFRERAAHLSNEIRKDLPDLTVHDITHLDALWEIASLIVGEDYFITPAEGYVLGGAILLHDLAMSVAATDGGVQALKNDPRWSDLVCGWFLENENRDPTGDETDNPPINVRKYVLFNLLRQKHAENAEKLAFMHYMSGGSDQMFLIEDTELRQTFGEVIGKIAHSHWWSIDGVEREFSRTIGAPHWAPSSWTIDPIKIACILRAADAAHIDARRAPIFARAISPIEKKSEPHWIFQEKLNKPYVRDDSLLFTSGEAFPLEDAGAWWLCLEALQMIDRELRGIDALLADKGMKRFAAKHVGGVDSPERLSSYIKTNNWLPINATVHISDLPHIIRSVGGEELYGNKPTVPLRELIQNASDAIRARRIYESRDASYGEVRISLIEKAGVYDLRVEDNGIGMSQRVLTDFMLDFGRSFWKSPEMQEEFPGLLSAGFKATGKYGIGFFSVFMISDTITVITRRADAAKKDTLIMEFGLGLSGRPIIRPAEYSKQLRDGGTAIIARLRTNPFEKGGLLYSRDPDERLSLSKICESTAPALDVKLVTDDGQIHKTVIEVNDWKSISGENLLERIGDMSLISKVPNEKVNDRRRRIANNLREIKDSTGNVIGRACITLGSFSGDDFNVAGKMVAGGLVISDLRGIAGIIQATPTRAARDKAKPLATKEALACWAEEQAELVPELWPEESDQMTCAQNIRHCGGKTKSLPVGKFRNKWVSSSDIEAMSLPDTLILVDQLSLKYEIKHVVDFVLDENVICTIWMSFNSLLIDEDDEKFGIPPDAFFKYTVGGAVLESIATNWGVQASDIMNDKAFNAEEEIRIGQGANGEIKCTCMILRKPPSI